MYYSSIHDHPCQSNHDEDGGYDGDHGDGEDLLCMHVCLYMFIYVVCTNVRICTCMYAYMYGYSLFPAKTRGTNSHLWGDLSVIPIADDSAN